MTVGSVKLDRLKKSDFKGWHLSMWLVKRRLEARVAHYQVARLDVESGLRQRLRDMLLESVRRDGQVLEDYEFLGADQDGVLLSVEAAETDFPRIQAAVEQGLEAPKVERFEDLRDTWAYVLKLERAEQAVYGVRKISRSTRVTKPRSYFLFRDSKLAELADEGVFTLDLRLDFFVHDGVVFILDKREFESVLNFRAGMERNRDTVLREVDSLHLLSDVEPLRVAVGSNLHLLRRVSAIQRNGYYRDPEFMKNLVELNRTEAWVPIEHGRIVVTAENVDTVLTLLNNGRLRSPVNNELFDAAVKKKVS
jgi:hypothetical protein